MQGTGIFSQSFLPFGSRFQRRSRERVCAATTWFKKPSKQTRNKRGRLNSRKMLRSKVLGQPETEGVVTVGRIVPITGRHAHPMSIRVPRTAARHSASEMARFAPFRTIDWGARIVVMPTILNPFPDVSMYVEKPPGIGSLRSDRNGSTDIEEKIATKPGVVPQRFLVATE